MIEKIERAKERVDTLIDRARDAVVGAADGAEHRVESLAGRVVEGAHVAGKRVRSGAGTASRGAHRRVESAATALDGGIGKAQSDLSQAATAASAYVTENPVKAVLLATSAGFVLGLLARRRRLPA